MSKLASRPATPTRPQRMLSDGENVAGDGEDVTDADAGVDAAAAADDDGMNRANID